MIIDYIVIIGCNRLRLGGLVWLKKSSNYFLNHRQVGSPEGQLCSPPSERFSPRTTFYAPRKRMKCGHPQWTPAPATKLLHPAQASKIDSIWSLCSRQRNMHMVRMNTWKNIQLDPIQSTQSDGCGPRDAAQRSGAVSASGLARPTDWGAKNPESRTCQHSRQHVKTINVSSFKHIYIYNSYGVYHIIWESDFAGCPDLESTMHCLQWEPLSASYK